jgi:hypothetical protein
MRAVVSLKVAIVSAQTNTGIVAESADGWQYFLTQ